MSEDIHTQTLLRSQSSAGTVAHARPDSPPRVLSLDALRGFDMFWIIGAEEIVHALHHVRHSRTSEFLARQLTHKEWEGFAAYDLIFPLFIFIVGVSLVFSLTRVVAQHGRAGAYGRIIRRSAVLYALGVLYYGGISEGLDHVRLLGVLQRIALCYLFAGLLFTMLRTRGLVIACAVLLVGYWAAMSFVPVPGIGAGHFEEGKNLANWIDSRWLPLWKWEDLPYDPEGLLSTLPAIATCLLGVFAGLLLRSGRVSNPGKILWLLAGGTAAVVLGYLWGQQFPVIKKTWTSSFVLVAGGYSAILLAVFYLMVDVCRLQRWAMPFIWIGVNPITLYLLTGLVSFRGLASRFVGGEIKAAMGAWGEVLVAGTAMALVFLVAGFLYQRRIFIRA